MLRCKPTDSLLRLTAALTHRALGEEAEGLAQLGFALTIDPDNDVVHRHIAAALRRRGDQVAADAVLENGWKVRRKARRILPVQNGEWERYFTEMPEEPS